MFDKLQKKNTLMQEYSFNKEKILALFSIEKTMKIIMRKRWIGKHTSFPLPIKLIVFPFHYSYIIFIVSFSNVIRIY